MFLIFEVLLDSSDEETSDAMMDTTILSLVKRENLKALHTLNEGNKTPQNTTYSTTRAPWSERQHWSVLAFSVQGHTQPQLCTLLIMCLLYPAACVPSTNRLTFIFEKRTPLHYIKLNCSHFYKQRKSQATL